NFNAFVNYVNTQPVTQQAIYQQVTQRLDVVNFVDYCLLNAYVAMGDWPANNWRAGRERSTNGIWRFIVWDAEWAMGIYSLSVNRDSFAFSGTGTEDAGLNSTVNSEIARIYQRLRPNPEFRLLWADRIHKHFFNNGALTGANITNRFNELRDQLRGFIPAMDTEILQWARDRHNIVMAQFNTYGLYGYSNALYGVFASSNAPVFNRHGGRVAPGFSLTMTNPLGGTIYYTLNGDDPRVPFTGAVSNSATAYAAPVTLTGSVTVKARSLLNGTNWSALAEARFEVGSLGVPLRITEIMYNPPGGSLFEFIEVQNVGAAPVTLGGMTLSDDVSYVFPVGASLAPGARLVLANGTDPAQFATRYGAGVAFGYFNGNLDNAGGRIVLSDAEGRVIQTVDYDDENGWPRAADGGGRSLEIVNPNGNPDDPANWRASATLNGSPGAPNPPPPAPAAVLNEVLADNAAAVNHGGTFPDWVELHNPGAAAVDLTGWSLSDDGNARKFVFPEATTIAAGGYLIVWCDAVTNTTPGLHAGFSLERAGESLFLYDAQTNLVDAITFGLQIPDYSVGRLSESWNLNTPTPGAPNSAAALAPASSLSLNEWLANPSPGQPDWVELFNRSLTLPASLQGIYLGTTGTVERLQALSFIAPGGHVQLFADEGVGPDHLGFRLPAAGGGIVLYDETATELERVTYGAQLSGVSQGRLPDGTATIVGFPGSVSPAAMNYISTYTGPVLNEVLARNGSVPVDGVVVDFIELHNAGAAPFDLGGMSLSINEAKPGNWRFAPGTVVPAGGYLVVPCDGSRAVGTNAAALNLGEPLDGESGGVYLFNAAGQLVNSVEYGFQIEDRSIGLSGGQWRLLAAATPGAANAATETLGTNSALRVNEWMAAPAAGADWFELYNSTNRPVDLSTISLTDHPSLAERGEFRVAPLSFIAGGGFVKWVADGNAGQGRNHVNFALDGAGDSVLVYGVSGTNFTLIDGVGFGPQALGVSVGRLPDGAGDFSSFPGSPTPAASNYRLIDSVAISEVLTHTDSPLEDSIELRNLTASPVSVGGWYLSNSRDNPRKFRIPDGTTIPAGGHIVILERDFNDGSTNGFGLNSAHGDEVWLSATDMLGNLTGDRTAARFGAAFNGVSFNRVQTSVGVDYALASERTLGSANAAPRVGPVVINEIHYHPAGLTAGDEEYVELHNTGAASVPLFDPGHPENRWKIDGGIRFDFPGGLTMAAGGYLLVVRFDPAVETARLAAFRARHGLDESVPVLGPFLGRLSDEEDGVELYQPDAPQGPGAPDAGFVPYVLVDHVHYTDAPPWPAGAVDGGGLSLQRRGAGLYGNEPLHWLASAPTPAAANGGGMPAPPTITTSPHDQTVSSDATATFTVQAGGAGPLSYQWRFNGMPLPDATNAVLVIAYAQLEHTGSYDVIVNNPGGAALSTAASLTVNAPAVILLPPASPVIPGGGSANLTVQATGTAPLRYEWWRNGVFIPSVTGPTFPISNARFVDGGEYVVRVSNAFGSMSTNASLTVLIDPTIVVQPVAQFGPRGSSVVLSVMVTNEATWPISYRWRRNGASVATNFLYSHVSFFTVTNIQGSNLWTVVVTNRSRPAGYLSSGAPVVALDDSDGDGIPDRDETALGLNPNDPSDGAADTDGDGLTNAEEHLAGTSHTDPESYLKVDRITQEGSAVLSFTAVAGRTYSVLSKDSLADTEWTPLADIPARTTTRAETVTDTRPPATRFYRLVTPGRN
ncbi:MAG TPA: lamin tail domain-containing protein, partial [Methylomirabilota bacterium]|nr:lamin tail domain-containing protein [Methylomirabilota bacterium]